MSWIKKLDRVTLVKYLLLLTVVVLIFGPIIVTGTYAKYNTEWTYARYHTEGQGQDSARIANWTVDTSDEGPNASDSSYTKRLTIDSVNNKASFNFQALNKKNDKVTERLTKFTTTVTVSDASSSALPKGVELYITSDKDDNDPNKRIYPNGYTPDQEGPLPNVLNFEHPTERTESDAPAWLFQPAESAVFDLYLVFKMDPAKCTETKVVSDIHITLNFEQVTEPNS